MNRSIHERILRSCFVLMISCIFMFVISDISSCQDSQLQAQNIDAKREVNVKAANIYGFCRYVTWPGNIAANSPIKIGMTDKGLLFDVLTQISTTRDAGGKKLVVEVITEVDQSVKYDLIVMTKNTARETQLDIIKAVNKKPILIVSETENMAANGATISFFIEQETVHFEINTDVVKQQGLQFNAKLLSLGRPVQSVSQK